MTANDRRTFGLRPKAELCDSLKANWGGGPARFGHGWPAVDIQLENARDHDHRLRAVPVLEHCKLEGFSATDEKAAAEPLLILHDPVAVAVPADAE
jgi:hypothetical protein